jgi:hypothetical protein
VGKERYGALSYHPWHTLICEVSAGYGYTVVCSALALTSRTIPALAQEACSVRSMVERVGGSVVTMLTAIEGAIDLIDSNYERVRRTSKLSSPKAETHISV